MKKLLDKTIIGYKINHPDEKTEKEITDIILDEIQSIITKNRKENDIIFSLTQNNYFAAKIRKEVIKKSEIQTQTKDILSIIYENYINNLEDTDYFRFSKKYAVFAKDNEVSIIGNLNLEELREVKQLIESKNQDKDLKFTYYETYTEGTYKIDDITIEIDSKGNIKANTENVIYGELTNPNHLTETKNYRYLMYALTPLLIKLLNEDDEELIKVIQKIDDEVLTKTVNELVKSYIKSIDVTEVLKGNDFKISSTIKEILTNAKALKLMDEISGTILEGRIKLATNRGYQTKMDKKQQDAILSIARNEKCFLNMIADGMGGAENSECASAFLTEEIEKWFKALPDEILEDVEAVTKLLKYKVSQVDSLIYKKYKKSYTTLVLALTLNDVTVIANIGDSTAYTYDNEKDSLIQLTTLDSDSKDMDYEDARYNPNNNAVTAAIGAGFNDPLHINIIKNEGQKIILSSDGITDLISEERFKSYFINDTIPEKMVEDALSKEDTEYLYKTEDNISVITIDLPNNKNKVKKLG